ncbi:MAG: hypothetical protein QNK75_06730 [Crocinitomicaceae bacterium]|jgi:hypothetical protein
MVLRVTECPELFGTAFVLVIEKRVDGQIHRLGFFDAGNLRDLLVMGGDENEILCI